MEKEVVLKIENVTKTYGERKSVDDLSLEVYAGEIFGFLGPNGAGKTTTIRMITGLSKITSGEIYIAGYSIKTDFNKAIRNIGGIIENPEMYKYMSGYDNLKYYAGLYDGISEDKIKEVVSLVHMENRIHEKVKNYSLGMRQRVGIAQSLLHSPRLLLLDEPTNGLDPAGIREMRDFLKNLAANSNIGIFISSHILSEMQLMCDRVGIVSNGKLVDIKSLSEWTDSGGNNFPIKLIATNMEIAMRILEKEFGVTAEVNGQLLMFKLNKDRLQELSLKLAKSKIGVLHLSKGEKTLEDTFLELTGKSSTII